MVMAIGSVGALASMASLGSLSAMARTGRPLPIGAAATSGNQAPLRKIATAVPSPLQSADVRISDAGREALAASESREAVKVSFIASETAAAARANRGESASIPVAGSTALHAPGDALANAGISETTSSDRLLVSLILALLAQLDGKENSAAVSQASQLVVSL